VLNLDSWPFWPFAPSTPVDSVRQVIPGWAENILNPIIGASWLVVYLMVVRRGFRDRYLCIPLVAAGFNIAWEFAYSMVFQQQTQLRIFNTLWFLLDIVIITQAYQYGRKDYPSLSPRLYALAVTGLLAFSFPFMVLIGHELGDREGGYPAFGLLVFMSFAFISVLWRRGSTVGQTMYIAVIKMIGGLASSILFFNWYPERTLLYLFYVSAFVLDWIYIVMLYRRFRAEGRSPLRTW
jgi:hypothetical protein